MFLISLGILDLKIGHVMAFSKALYVYFVFLKFQLLTHFILGAIGLEVRASPRRSDPK